MQRPGLTTLPAELHLKIFDSLAPEASVCLGLTCKKLYPLFFARQAKTHLRRLCDTCGRPIENCGVYGPAGRQSLDKCPPQDGSQKALFDLLRDWKPKNLAYSFVDKTFVNMIRRGGFVLSANQRPREQYNGFWRQSAESGQKFYEGMGEM